MSDVPNYIHRFQKWWHSPLAKIALVLGVGVHLAGFLAFRVIVEPTSARAAPPPFIQWSGSSNGLVNPIVREQALLLDSEALFLPTALNASSEDTTLRQATPGQTLLATQDDSGVTMDLNWDNGGNSVTNVKPMTAYQLLGRYSRDTLNTFGQVSVATAPANRSYAQIQRFHSGESLGNFELETGETLPANTNGPELLEFILYRTNTGSVGRLLPLSPAASATAGQAWSEVVENSDWIAALPEGYYRIIVSP